MRKFSRTVEYNHNMRFGGLRELAIQRDGEKCVNCGMTRQEHRNKWNSDITVDHSDGYGRYSDYQNNDLDNLRTLCLRCHGKKDRVRSKGWSSERSKLKSLSNLKYWKGGDNNIWQT